jgi:hypothetical protein
MAATTTMSPTTIAAQPANQTRREYLVVCVYMTPVEKI